MPRICNKCGAELEKNDSFCAECGEKYSEESIIYNSSERACISEEEKKKLKDEVIFYYELSAQKKEGSIENSSMLYYGKAQSVLDRLLEIDQGDCWIWWQKSKPVDFYDPLLIRDIGKYRVDECKFSKALDLASIDEKKVVIEEYDVYVEKKKTVLIEERRKEESKKLEDERIMKAKQGELKANQEKQRQYNIEQKEREEAEQREVEQERLTLENQMKAKKMEERPANLARIFSIAGWVTSIYTIPAIPFWVLTFVYGSIGMKSSKRKLARGSVISSVINIAIIALVFIIVFASI